MRSLLLDVVGWDLVLDAFGNIAIASDPYSIAQDVSCAIRLFQSELWYDTLPGVPYWRTTLGMTPSITYLKAKFVAAAMTVPGVKSAVCYISSVKDRTVTGQVQITTDSGQTLVAAF